jgi:uncharacterized protein with NAD-binding domain and iron-sulfur cluster
MRLGGGMSTQEQPKKVAVLGGGPAAIAAAFDLTADSLKGRFEVTVYQPGWRLGGKCASGRNPAANRGSRIEEHGLHIWFGFYDNAFRVMREAYDELGRTTGPLRTLEEAFKGCEEAILFDRQEGRWETFALKAPVNSQKPGVQAPPPGFWDIARWMCEWAAREYKDRGSPGGGTAPFSSLDDSPGGGLRPALEKFAAGEDGAGAPAGEGLLDAALALSQDAQAKGTDLLPRPPLRSLGLHAVSGTPVEHLLAKLLSGFRDWLFKELGSRLQQDADLRLFFTIFDTFASATAGIVEEDVLSNGWESINDHDLCDWLKMHGAKEVTLGATPADRSPMLRSIYDVAFGYREGKIANADIAAGTAINDFLRLSFGYRGSPMYKMQAGMGDTVFTPFYEVLKKRGVTFKFFHAVTELGLSADGELVQEITVVPQVAVPAGEYRPLVKVKELGCWPSEPLWDQLAGGEELKKREIDFERSANPLGCAPVKLRLGSDFDQVVLGIPVGAIKRDGICAQISARHPRFAQMLANAATVRTQAFQLWLTQTPGKLGWPHPENSVAGTYAEPLDTWCDMTHLLARENWSPADGVAGLAYFCGVLDELPGEGAAEATARVFQNMLTFLATLVGPLWPRAVSHRDGAMDFSWLADPGRFIAGPGRAASQYWRANTTGSEEYVLTPAGSVKHRLAAGASGIGNLVLAGDWTLNGIDGGCVEAAVTSGVQAAAHLSGAKPQIVGHSPTWLSDPNPGPIAMPPPLGPQGGGGGGGGEDPTKAAPPPRVGDAP